MARRNRPPALLDIETLRVVGSVVGQIELDLPDNCYRLGLARHPSGAYWGMFADIALSDEPAGRAFAVQLVGTFDLGTGSWKKAAGEDVADYLGETHGQVIWRAGTAVIRQVAAICQADIDLSANAPDPEVTYVGDLPEDDDEEASEDAPADATDSALSETPLRVSV